MDDMNVSVLLEMREVNGEHIADVTFVNQGAHAAALYIPSSFVSGEVMNDVFRITIDGALVPYERPYVKRAAPKREDFWILGPSERVTQSVNVSDAYGIKSSKARRIVYDAFHGDVDLWGGLWRLISDEVSF